MMIHLNVHPREPEHDEQHVLAVQFDIPGHLVRTALRELPDFAGNISDLEAPTANMYGMGGR